MIWKVSDVMDGVDYRICLSQTPDGVRQLRLVEAGSGKDGTLLRTSPVARELLLKRDLIAISESVTLENGEKFYVDAHGVWYVESELIQRKNGVPFIEIIWITGVPPKLPSA